jgi:2-oxoglutarate dehydrogenase E1 component
MTPKSLLTHPECVSRLEDFGQDSQFHEVIDDDREDPDNVSRLIFCTGKVYYDLIEFRRRNEINNVAIIRLEQIYPFFGSHLRNVASRYVNATKWVWCQEEPLNMGAWTFVGPRLQKMTDHHVRYAGRDSAASPSTGSKTIHKMEQRRLIEEAFHK